MDKGSALREHPNRLLGLAIAALVFILDQAVKWAVVNPLELRRRGEIDVLPIFKLEWVPNPGVSMGFLPAQSETGRWVLTALTAAISVAVLVWLWRERRRGDAIALGLVLGGALGNILDRIRFGHVIDFANLHFGAISPFLVYNVGDAAITIGVLLLIVRALIVPNAKKEV
jgi:signal peptidase II